MLAAVFSGRHTLKLEDGHVLIDRDGDYFGFILNWLRDGDVPAAFEAHQYKQLLKEADYFQLRGLIDGIHISDFTPLEVIKYNWTNFDKAVIEGATFCDSNLQDSVFTEANIGEVPFVGANLKCTKFTCANLERTDFSRDMFQSTDFSCTTLSYIDFWHRRMCHLNHQDMVKLSSKEAVRGIPKLASIPQDLVGPVETKSIGGRKYALVIVDDFSRFI
ncbi:hypothetical protein ACLB2K_027313 [Fragaria x ananassa]